MARFKTFQFRECTLLDEEQKVVADKEYISNEFITPENECDIDRVVHARLHTRHESRNARIQSYGIAKPTSRHSL